MYIENFPVIKKVKAVGSRGGGAPEIKKLPNGVKNPHTDSELKAANQLTGSELFSLFTADIIKEKTLFTR